jgi:WD40 repeat protein
VVGGQPKSRWKLGRQRGYTGIPDPLGVAFSVNILGGVQIPLRANTATDISTVQRSATTPKAQNPSASTGAVEAIDALSPAATVQAAPTAATGKVRKRIRRGVTALAVSGDGGSIASAGTDKRILVFSPGTGIQRLALQGSLGLPTGLAFSPSGTLSSVARDSYLRLWDGASGRELAKLAGHESPIDAVASSPNGAFVATAGEETRIMLWDQTSRKLSKILYGAKNFINAVSFSPDSRLLAGAGEDARVVIFDVTTGKLLFTLLGHAAAIDTVAFSPNGKVLASAGQDTEIHLWDPAKGQQLQVLRGHQAPIRTIAFSPDGVVMASGGEDTQIRLWNVATGALGKVLSGSTGAINALAFDPKGLFLASASESGDITLWNVNSGAKIISIRVPGAL